MLNVCFGDCECGMLKVALDGEPVTYSHRALEIGQITPARFTEARRKWIDSAFSVCSKRRRAKIWKEDCKRFKKIVDAAKKEKNLRIWCASSARAKCGLYHLIYSLQGIDCALYVVEMPSYVGFRRPPFDKSWGEADSDEARDCLKFQRKLTKEECVQFAQIWEKLATENAELRLNINGQITSLPVGYLDNEIVRRAPKNSEFKLGWLVGEMLGKSTHILFNTFVSDRIEALIDSGEFAVVKKMRDPKEYYNSILRIAIEEDKKSASEPE